MKRGIRIFACTILVLTIALNTTLIVKGTFFDKMPSIFGYIPLVAASTIESEDINKGDLIICKEEGEGTALSVTEADGTYTGYAYYTGHKIPALGQIAEFCKTPAGLAALVLSLLAIYLIGEEKEVFYPSSKRLEVK